MKKYLLILLMLCSVSLSAAEWQQDYKQAVAQAAKEGKAVLIDFYSDNCGPCIEMARTTLKDDKVLKQLAGFILLKINIMKHKALAEQYVSSGIPHFVILNRQTEIVAESTVFQAADSFAAWIKKYRTAALSSDSVNELSEKDKSVILSIAKHPGASLMILSADYQKSQVDRRRVIMEAMHQVKVKDLLPGLLHERLQVRIFSQLVLRQIKGEKIDFDAWAPAEKRKKQFALISGAMKNE